VNLRVSNACVDNAIENHGS